MSSSMAIRAPARASARARSAGLTDMLPAAPAHACAHRPLVPFVEVLFGVRAPAGGAKVLHPHPHLAMPVRRRRHDRDGGE